MITKPLPLVYFLCTGNSCRSQMAEGWARALAGDRMNAASAGIAPQDLHPLAVRVMAEVGIDISRQQSKAIDPQRLASAAVIITLCGDARDRCPVTPAAVPHIHWDLPDPARVDGTEAERWAAFCSVRDQIRKRLEVWLGQGPAMLNPPGTPPQE